MWFAKSIYLSAKSSSKTTLKSRAYKHKNIMRLCKEALPNDAHLADGLKKPKQKKTTNPQTNKKNPQPTEF